jgi:hypothetical protein
MANIADTPRKLVLQEGSTTLALDKETGKATLQQKILLWKKKPIEFRLADIDDISVRSVKDGLSGAEIHHSVLHRRSGEVTVLTTEEAKDAAATVDKLRGFVGLQRS